MLVDELVGYRVSRLVLTARPEQFLDSRGCVRVTLLLHGARVKVERRMAHPAAVERDAPLQDIVHLMERHQIKRVLVARDGKLVGIVTRANLLHALASVAAETKPGPTSDTSIRERLYAELKTQPWAPVGLVNIVVRNGVVHLSGTLFDERHRDAIRVAAERIAGVKGIEDHLVCIDPVSGMVMHAF